VSSVVHFLYTSFLSFARHRLTVNSCATSTFGAPIYDLLTADGQIKHVGHGSRRVCIPATWIQQLVLLRESGQVKELCCAQIQISFTDRKDDTQLDDYEDDFEMVRLRRCSSNNSTNLRQEHAYEADYNALSLLRSI
jgi:hypothetical protein